MSSLDSAWYEKEADVHRTWWREFPSSGQGTATFKIIRSSPFSIVVRPVKPAADHQWIALEISKDGACFKLGAHPPTTLVHRSGCTDYGDTVGLVPERRIAYWFSFDRDRLVVKYGKGYTMTESTLLEYDFLKGKGKESQQQVREELFSLFSPLQRKIIELYDVGEELLLQTTHAQNGVLADELGCTTKKCRLSDVKGLVEAEGMVEFSRCPFVANWPSLILDSSKVSLFEMDESRYMFSASLPLPCQELYANVARAQYVDLDWSPDANRHKLSDAIRYSINTKGKLLHRKLREKSGLFCKDSPPEESYLRVGLGPHRGNSPGIPYVLEIWPSKHYSPIHNHGNAYAIIKVVHGGLTVRVFNKHDIANQGAKPLKEVDIHKGDVTWISPNWYQTHQLVNSTTDFCATIQCYQYGEGDSLHWPYFDYLSTQNVIEEFLPNTDFQFRELREQLMKEYADSLAT